MGKVYGQGMLAHRFGDFNSQSTTTVFVPHQLEITPRDAAPQIEQAKELQDALTAANEGPFVFFSSSRLTGLKSDLSAYDHQLFQLEQLVAQSTKPYIILRLPYLLGPTSEQTDFFSQNIQALLDQAPGQSSQETGFYWVDLEAVHQVVRYLITSQQLFNQTIELAGAAPTDTSKLVEIIERFTGKSAVSAPTHSKPPLQIDTTLIAPVLSHLKLYFDVERLETRLQRSFAHLLNPPKLLSIIVPTYNEEHGIEEFYRRTKAVLAGLAPRFTHELIFVNDFSTDNTLEKLNQLSKKDPTVKVINFARNFGNQIGITAGIDVAQGDLAVIIDDDLQDPPELILNLISKWDDGYDVVYGVRPKRQGVNPLFKLTTKIYYKVIAGLSEVSIPHDTGDFRLIDSVVMDVLRDMREESRYYRGMVSWVGFSQYGVKYERDKRYTGVSTFSFKKYVNFALTGLTSFTEKPLFFSSLVGALITCTSFLLALFLIINKIVNPTISIRGWTSIIVVILFFGGIQLLSIGIIGVYIGKIYREVKARPLYIIEKQKKKLVKGSDK